MKVVEKVINFGAGPAKLPEAVLEKAHSEFLEFPRKGLTILEVSHRSSDFANILDETIALLRDQMSVPNEYEILLMQGGGTGQFAAIPLNIKGESEVADYAVTGAWSSKAANEAAKYIEVNKVFTPGKQHITVPNQAGWKRDPKAAYLYYCANETVHGVEFSAAPETFPDVPLVADVSSNILSRPFSFRDHGIVFAGAQKNLGMAGVTVVIVRHDLIGREHRATPSVFSYAEMLKNKSVYNTPCVYGIYITKLVLEWIRDSGGVHALHDINKAKSSLIYDIIDNSSSFYSCPVDKSYRSRMNIPFRIGGQSGDEALEKKFLAGAIQEGMIGLKGHRSVGGIRASLYNAVTMEETRKLGDYMREFHEQHSA